MSAPAQVAEFVRALALGWKNLAAYPRGHPALAASLQQLQQKLDELRGPAATQVAFGIAADGLIVGGEKIGIPQAQKLAQALYARGVAVLRFDPGTTATDLETFLRLLGFGVREDAAPPIFDQLTAAGVININLQPVDYSSLQVTDTLAPEEKKAEGRESLWEHIVRALTEGERLGSQSSLHAVQSIDQLSALLSHYIDESEEAVAFDANATFGVQNVRVPAASAMLTARVAHAIGEYLAGSSGLQRQFVLGQITQLLRTLPEALRAAVIRSVLRVVATDESAGALLRDFTAPLGRDEIVDALRSLGASLSTHATLLLRSLLEVAPSGHRPEADGSLASVVAELFNEEDVDRFNPEDHRTLLEGLAIEIPTVPAGTEANPARLGDRVGTIADEAVSRQLAHTVLDLLEGHGHGQEASGLLSRVERCFRGFVETAQFAEAIEVVRRLRHLERETASSQLRAGVGTLLADLAAPQAIQHLVTGLQSADKETATALIRQLIEALGTAAAQNLLVALAEENNRSRRRRLFDFVCRLGPTVVPVAVSFLHDSRWYVVRNMILVLRTVGDRTSLPQIRRCAHHPDLRVRLEAIKTLLAFDSSVPSSLLHEAINHPDPKMAETAISLVASYGIKEGVVPLLKILDGRDVLGSRRMLRVRAIKALGELADTKALPHIERFFRENFLPWPSKEERRAAYESLAGYPPEERRRFIDLGRTSKDPEIRAICERLAPPGGETWKR